MHARADAGRSCDSEGMHDAIVRRCLRQHGVFTRRQALDDGVPSDNIGSLLRRGHIVGVTRGVYRPAAAPLTPMGELLAAVWRCAPGAAAAGERLLALLGVRGAAADGDFTVLVAPGRRISGIDWRWRPDPYPAGRRAEVLGIPSVPPVRNLVEAAVDVSDGLLETLVHGTRWLPGGLRGFDVIAAAAPWHPGVRRLQGRGLVDAGAPESHAEWELDPLLLELGARRQVWVTPTIRVDYLFPNQWLVIERDGRAAHAGPTAREKDLAQSRALQALGLAVRRLGADDVRDLDALREELVTLLATLGDRGVPFVPDGTG